MTPNRSQPPDRAEPLPSTTPVDATTLDPDFDDLDDAHAEFTAWRWPERDDG